jgi:hypothetical protein
VRELIKQLLREELSSSLKRRLNFVEIDKIINRQKVEKYQKNNPIEDSIDSTIHVAMYDIMPREYDDLDTVEYYKFWDSIKDYLKNKYTKELRQYFEKRRRDAEEDVTSGIKYIFVKHDKPYNNSGWRGFADGFNSFDDMITRYGNMVDVDWDKIKKKLDNMNDYPVPTYTDTMNSRPLRISSIGDEGNDWGYNFSIIKQVSKDNVDVIK